MQLTSGHRGRAVGIVLALVLALLVAVGQPHRGDAQEATPPDPAGTGATATQRGTDAVVGAPDAGVELTVRLVGEGAEAISAAIVVPPGGVAVHQPVEDSRFTVEGLDPVEHRVDLVAQDPARVVIEASAIPGEGEFQIAVPADAVATAEGDPATRPADRRRHRDRHEAPTGDAVDSSRAANGSIQVDVVGSDGGTPQGGCLDLYTSPGFDWHDSTCTPSSGSTWTIADVPPGTYRLEAWGFTTYSHEWYDDADSFGSATEITVGDDETVQLNDVVLAKQEIISGTVTYENGDPVANACAVQFYQYNEEFDYWANVRSGCTDANGAYDAPLTPGVLTRVQFTQWPHGSTWYDGAWARDNATAVEAPATGIDGVLPDAVASDELGGVILDADGNGVSGVSVHYRESQDDTRSTPDLPSVQTDTDGRFSISLGEPDAFWAELAIAPTGPTTGWVGDEAYAGEFTMVTLGDRTVGTDQGVVVDQLGPVASSDLTIEVFVGAIRFDVATAGDGSVIIPPLVAGDSYLLSSPSHAPTYARLPADGVWSVELQLLTAVSGTVADTAGTGLAGQPVAARQWRTGLVSGRMAPHVGGATGAGQVTGPDGDYTIQVPVGKAVAVEAGTRPGEAFHPDIVAAGDSWSSDIDALVATDSSPVGGVDVTVPTSELGSVSGTFLVDGSAPGPQDGLLVSLMNANGTFVWSHDLYVDFDGANWTFENVPAGEYLVCGEGHAGRTGCVGGPSVATATVVTVGAGEDVSGLPIDLLSGTARLSGTTTPDALVVAATEVPDWNTFSTQADPEGDWTLEGLPSGAYRVSARTDQAASQRFYPGVDAFGEATEVLLGHGEAQAGLAIPLPPGQSTVIFDDTSTGDDQPSASVYPAEGSRAYSIGEVGSGGSVAPGTYKLFVHTLADAHDGSWIGGGTYADADVFTLADGDTVDLGAVDTAQGVNGGVRGTVYDGAGDAVHGASVWLYDDAGEVVFVTASGVDGSYEVPWDVPGDYYVEARHPGLGSAWHADANLSGSAPVSFGSTPWSTADVHYGQAPVPESLRFVESEPCAVFDTSDASDPGLAGRNDGGDVLTFVVASDSALPAGQGAAGCAGPPAGAVAVELNLVARQPAGRGNLKVSAAGTVASGGVVNFSPGVTNASSVPVPLDGQGRVDVEVNSNDDDATYVRGVVLGYYVDPDAAGPAATTTAAVAAGDGRLFVPSDACAVFDTRHVGPPGGGGDRFDGQETRTFQVAGDFDPQGQGGKDCVPPPADVSGVLVNLVAIGPDNNGNLKAVASGGTASGGVVNFAGGMGNNSNAVPVGVSASGAIDVTANTVGAASVDVRGVVLGYYVDDGHADAADGLELVPATACAVFDTRHGEGVFADRTDGGQTVTATVAADGALPDGQGPGACTSPPASAEAVMLNLVAITPDDNGNLQLAPAGVAPDGGVVNFTSHRGTNSNAVVTGVDADGDVDVTTKATIADAVDVRGVALGWYADPN